MPGGLFLHSSMSSFCPLFPFSSRHSVCFWDRCWRRHLTPSLVLSPLGALVQGRSTAAPGERLRLPPLPVDPQRVPFAPETRPVPGHGAGTRRRDRDRAPGQTRVSGMGGLECGGSVFVNVLL